MEITPLPKLDYFINGSTHTGSVGTDPFTGCMSRTIFMYKALLAKDEDEHSYLAVSCHLQHPWNSSVINDEETKMNFELSNEGIEKAEEWLNKQCENLPE